MIPREAGRGSSFKGAGAYYLHDKEADTSQRVEFTHTENVPTNDPHKALKWMAWTAIHADELKQESGVKATGRKCAKPVFTFSLSWHPEQQPKKWDMIGAGRRALVALGLEDHETVMVAHSDRPHPHLHLIVNVIHPETGKVNNLPYSRKKLSEWAESYEREHGKIYCDQRVENNARREDGEYIKHREPEHDLKARVTELYRRSDSGASFQAGLKELGFTLAQGKRLVLIDREGKIHSLSRQIDGAKAKDIRTKFADLKLPDVDAVRKQLELVEPQAKPEPKPEPKQPPRPEPSPAELNRLQDRHLAELGAFYEQTNRARLALAAKHEAAYGQQERQLGRDIEQLENTLQNSGRFRRAWLKLTKQIPKEPEREIQNMRRSLDNLSWRKSEAQKALEMRTEQQRFAIQARQKQERLALAPEPYVSMQRDQAPRHSPEIDEGGPSFEY